MLKKFINTISSFFNSEPDYTLPHGILYKRILKSSYDKFFYVDLKVPDTIDGRFDIIIYISLFLLKFLKTQESLKKFLHKSFLIYL